LADYTHEREREEEMNTRIYLRIAKTGNRRGYKVAASTTPNYAPLEGNKGWNTNCKSYPTVAFAVDFNIPDELFKQAERVLGEINITTKQARVATEIIVPMQESPYDEKRGKK